MAFRRVRRSCVQRAVIYGPLATIPYTYKRHTRYAFSISSVHGGEPERPGHTRHFLVQRWAAFFHRCLSFVPLAVIASCGADPSFFFTGPSRGVKELRSALRITAVTFTSMWPTCKCSEENKNKIAKWMSLLRRESNAWLSRCEFLHRKYIFYFFVRIIRFLHWQYKIIIYKYYHRNIWASFAFCTLVTKLNSAITQKYCFPSICFLSSASSKRKTTRGGSLQNVKTSFLFSLLATV